MNKEAFDFLYKNHRLRCGGCGIELHKLLQHEESIFVQCCGCKSVSEITLTQPKLNIDWTENSEGLLARF